MDRSLLGTAWPCPAQTQKGRAAGWWHSTRDTPSLAKGALMGKVLFSQPYISLQEELPVPALSVSHPTGHGCCRLSSRDPGPPPWAQRTGSQNILHRWPCPAGGGEPLASSTRPEHQRLGSSRLSAQGQCFCGFVFSHIPQCCPVTLGMLQKCDISLA